MKQESIKKHEFKHEIRKDKGIDFITVTREDNFKVTFTDLGAAIYTIYIGDDIMTLTPKYLTDYKRKNIYHGKIVGRYANRIDKGEITVAGEKYYLEQNEGTNSLHSGSQGFSNKYFEYEIRDDEKFFTILFTYKSPHLEAGFPGNFDITAIYYFVKDEEEKALHLKIIGKTDYETIFRPTNHAYFSLGEDSLENMTLFMPTTDKYVIPDEKMLPTKLVDAGALNFSEQPAIFSDLFALDEIKNSVPHGVDHYFQRKKDFKYDLLQLDGSRYTLLVMANYGGIHLYSDNIIDGVEYFNTNKENHRGLAIEPCDPPLKKSVLKPGEVYERDTAYIFKEK